MSRPSRLEILEYALEGAVTERGLWSGAMTDEQETALDNDIAWLEKEIARLKEKEKQ